MSRYVGGRVRRRIGAVARTVTLLVSVSAVVTGCRQETLPGGPTVPVPISPVFHSGDTFQFDRWSLDAFGYEVPESLIRETWTVVRTGSTEEGERGVTVVNDQFGPGPATDLLILIRPTGEIAVFGALAAIVKDMGAGSITRHWDVLAPRGGLDPGVSWVVGVTDSSATDTAYGSFTSVPEYFAAQLNGVSTVFAAYRISVSSQRIQYTFWLTDSPACLPGFREESTFAGSGFEAFLSSVTTGPQ